MQAQLVAQLLCCIPLTSVEPVLTWLTSAMPQSEQTDLLLQVTSAVTIVTGNCVWSLCAHLSSALQAGKSAQTLRKATSHATFLPCDSGSCAVRLAHAALCIQMACCWTWPCY